MTTEWIDIRQILFPIGYIWMSNKNESPATLFGGTWYKVEEECFWRPDSAIKDYMIINGKTSIIPETKGSNFILFNYLPKMGCYLDTRAANGGKYPGSLVGIGKIPEYNQIYFDEDKRGGQWASVVTQSGTGQICTYAVELRMGSGYPFTPKHVSCYCWIRIA